MAWRDGCLWAYGDPGMRERFRRDTGRALASKRSGLEAMIDEATGYGDAELEEFVGWWTTEIWGSELDPRRP